MSQVRDKKYKTYKDVNIEEAVKELDAYRAARQEIRHLKALQVQFQEDVCDIKAMRYDDVKVQGGAVRDAMLESTIRWAELDEKIHDIVERNKVAMIIIEEKLHRLKYDEREVLTLYYINSKGLEAVAKLLHMSFEGTKKLKKRALRAYANIKLGGTYE